MNNILVLENLTKTFRSHWTFRQKVAVRDVSLAVRCGEIMGFLGHNGAGKTTTMKCILGLIQKNSGQILFENRPLSKSSDRRQIGYLPELPYFYDHLTVLETVEFLAALYGLRGYDLRQKSATALKRVGLADRSHDKVRSLSKGLQQRLAFAQAIVNQPQMLLLDEPFSGLDPNGRAEFRELILNLHKNGTTIFLSSHILPDIQDICDRVTIMAYGSVRRELDLEELSNPRDKTYFIAIRNQPGWTELREAAEKVSNSIKQDLKCSGELFEILVENYEDAVALMNLALSKKMTIERFGHNEKQLEDIFLEVLKEGKS